MDRRDELALRRFERLKAWRGPRDRDVTIAPFVKQFLRDQTRASKSLGCLTEAFEAIVPGVILPECTLLGVRGSVLTIETRSASAQYALDRFLRTGGERDLCARSTQSGTNVTKIRVVCAHD
ncbi:MAG: hypothetical protein SGJ11_13875 [Phycisphaerae bacterium]|nr:hypothetical protein [Phycisphaerae bacterium]